MRGVTSRGNPDENGAGSGGERSHETWFPRGLAVSHRAHTDLREAIFCSGPEKATVGEVKSGPLGPSHAQLPQQQRLYGNIITHHILQASHILKR